jgi:hypothetical protein
MKMVEDWEVILGALYIVIVLLVIWMYRHTKGAQEKYPLTFKLGKDEVAEVCGIEVEGPLNPIVAMYTNGMRINFYDVSHINKSRIDMDKLIDLAARTIYVNGILRHERHKSSGPENIIRRECYKEKEWDDFGWMFNSMGGWFKRMEEEGWT